MAITELQDNDAMTVTLTEADVQLFYGSLPDNFNAIITFEQKIVTAFDSTIHLRTNAFSYELQKNLKFAPALLANTCNLRHTLLLQTVKQTSTRLPGTPSLRNLSKR
jgi:hypothetical protein